MGITVVYTDNQDLWKEKVVGDRYLVDGEWRELKIRKEMMKVKGKGD